MPTESLQDFPEDKTYHICVFRPTEPRTMLNFEFEVGKDYKFEYVPPVYAGRDTEHVSGRVLERRQKVSDGYYRVWPGADYSQRESCTPQAFYRNFSKVATPQDILNLVAPETL